MESLNDSSWDVVIAGTGLQESLLALALSRSGKKVLHVDKNAFYGGSEAALSLQEAEEWVAQVREDTAECRPSAFSSASIISPEAGHGDTRRLSFPRAYSIVLAPQLIYARSNLLPSLVSARVDNQLEFHAMGSWWTLADDNASESGRIALQKVPSGREDLFASQDLGASAKRSLMKFLRFLASYEEDGETLSSHGSDPFHIFLQSRFGIASSVQQPIHALTMSSMPNQDTTVSYALPRIARYLRSIGVFGASFGAVVPKWGGLAEIAQVGCRAGAVGGGVYVLGNGISGVTHTVADNASIDTTEGHILEARLFSGDQVKTTWLVGSHENLSGVVQQSEKKLGNLQSLARSVTVVASPLTELFTPAADGSPVPAGVVVYAPGAETQATPVHLIVHSSDTGECPRGQCLIYASAMRHDLAFDAIDRAIEHLLRSLSEGATSFLWQLRYVQEGEIISGDSQQGLATSTTEPNRNIIIFPPPNPDLVFDENVLSRVERTWRTILGSAATDKPFLSFPPREESDVEEG